jgi:transcriptional regulator of acetoin/glycerol metabolism
VEALSGFLSMLAVEGGVYPRGDASDDVFSHLGDKLGLLAAVPLGRSPDDTGLTLFVLAIEDGAHPHDGFAFAPFVEAVQAHDGAGVRDEITALAASSMLRSARRAARSRTSSNTAQVAASTPSPSVATAGAAGTAAGQGEAAAAEAAPSPGAAAPTPATSRWLEHLAEETSRRYPVDEDDALGKREWEDLAALRGSVAPALVMGEPGVGKEFAARATHHVLWGTSKRFATVDCSERPSSIVLLDLFGDEEGSGLVEAVEDGTLLIKGASAMAEHHLEELVARLARSRVRVVFAERTAGDSAQALAALPATIRRAVEDRVVAIRPLRERPEDVVRYARFFLHRAAMRYGADASELSPEVEQWLAGLHLVGNLYELETLVTTAVLRATGTTLAMGDVPAGDAPREATDLTPEEESERSAILEALSTCDGNRTRAAEALGMTRGSLLRRLRKYGIE